MAYRDIAKESTSWHYQYCEHHTLFLLTGITGVVDSSILAYFKKDSIMNICLTDYKYNALTVEFDVYAPLYS